MKMTNHSQFQTLKSIIKVVKKLAHYIQIF